MYLLVAKKYCLMCLWTIRLSKYKGKAWLCNSGATLWHTGKCQWSALRCTNRSSGRVPFKRKKRPGCGELHLFVNLL